MQSATLQRRSLGSGIVLLAVVALLGTLLLPGPLLSMQRDALRLVAYALVAADEPPAHVDAVAVHGGGSTYQFRERRALELYRAGRADRIVALGGPLPPVDPDRTYAGAVERRLLRLGAPHEAIVRLDRGDSTAAELDALRALAEERGWKKLALASSDWHTLRVALLAQRAFRGSEISWTVVALSDSELLLDRWWLDPISRQVVLAEWGKIGLALVGV